MRLLTKSVALSGARKRPPVRCNSVHPAFIEGDMVDAIVHGRPDPEKARAKLQAQIPIGRLGRPHEVAATRGLAAVAGLLVHDRLRGPCGRRPDRRLNDPQIAPQLPQARCIDGTALYVWVLAERSAMRSELGSPSQARVTRRVGLSGALAAALLLAIALGGRAGIARPGQPARRA